MCFEAFAIAAAARCLGNCFNDDIGGIRDRRRCHRNDGVGGERFDRCRRDDVGGDQFDRCRRGVGGERFDRRFEPDMNIHRGDCCDRRRDCF